MIRTLTLWRTIFGLAMFWAALGAALPAAHAAPGDLDLTFAGFGTGGKVFTNGVPMSTNALRGMALQPDGKIVVAGQTGSSLLVMRYLSNGALDASFGGDGIATHSTLYPVQAADAAVQADGKIVVAGWIESSPTDFMLARLTSTGALDTSFGTGGFVTTDFDADGDYGYAILVQPDGRIVACGWAWDGGDPDFAVARYNANGSLDTTFSGDGQALIGFGDDDQCEDVALLDDGDLVLVGQYYDTGFFGGGDFAVARLNADGSLDSSFDLDGKVTTGFGGDEDRARAVAIQPDGKIVAAGNDDDEVRVARYLPNGVLDSSFDGDGKWSIDEAPDVNIWDLVLQADGKLVLLGHQDGQFAFYRLNPGSSLDTTFDVDGKLLLNLGGDDRGYAVALQSDGRIIAYGATGSNHALVRLWPDGSLDAGGKQALDFTDSIFDPNSGEAAYALAVQADGKLVVAGDLANAGATDRNFALARFLPDGRLDTTFGTLGEVSFGFGGVEAARAIAIQDDGKIVAAGTTGTGSGANVMVARFNANGTPDNGFGFLGHQVIDFLGGEDHGTAVAVAPDGKIVVAGTSTSGGSDYFSVARFNTNGALDNTFSQDGMVSFQSQPGRSQAAYAVVVQSDLTIVVAGTFAGVVNDDFLIARLSEDGALDASFGTGGTTITNMGGWDAVLALAPTADGGLVAAGRVVYRGDTDFALARYTAAGALDSGFGTGGKAYVDFGGLDAALAVDVRGDGAIAAAGYSGAVMAVAQLQSNGALDPAFHGSGKATADFVGSQEWANAVQFVAPDTLVVAGYQTVNGNTNIALGRFETSAEGAAAGGFRLFLPAVMDQP